MLLLKAIEQVKRKWSRRAKAEKKSSSTLELKGMDIIIQELLGSPSERDTSALQQKTR